MVSVIASSMHGESHKAWKRATNKVSKRKCKSDCDRKRLIRLPQICIDFLDDVAKECLLDLGLFPENRKICVDALLDIWVYVRKLQRHDAFAILSEFARRNLLNLTNNARGSRAIQHRNAPELYFSQADGMRDLALYLRRQYNILHPKRLVIERQYSSFLGKCELLNDRAIDTQILSIITSPMEENQWYDMTFPETEVLLIFFTSTEYVLPPFLKSMKKLKFLMVSNCGAKKATVKGIDVMSSLTQLKSVRFESLLSPLGEKQSIEGLQNIEKLSMSLYEGFGNMSVFTKLKAFNLDHCSELEHLPLGLKELPASIGKLGELEYLDISACEGLKVLPKEIGKLKKLKEFDMRECSRLKALPTTVCELSSLKLVICDEKIGKQWLRARNISIPELRVEIVEAHFSLDWLDD
ncbi:hypothetical protein SUGI_0358750 [Cryptomeria japonica]|nr:hypothetical protein SUGI_0358750 [Cryptomeria japonica]